MKKIVVIVVNSTSSGKNLFIQYLKKYGALHLQAEKDWGKIESDSQKEQTRLKTVEKEKSQLQDQINKSNGEPVLISSIPENVKDLFELIDPSVAPWLIKIKDSPKDTIVVESIRDKGEPVKMFSLIVNPKKVEGQKPVLFEQHIENFVKNYLLTESGPKPVPV